MKKTILEELERIHSVTYGKDIIEEQKLFDKILRALGIKKGEDKKIDDPKKADFVSEDVKQFFETLEKIDTDIKQQPAGNYEYQKEVETVQIGLTLLGYDLPNHGVDGKYGPETAAAVQKFKEDNNLKSEPEEVGEVSFADLMNEITLVQLNDTGYSNVKFDKDQTQYDEVNKALLDDLQKAASAAGVVVTITTAKSGHGYLTKSGRKSRHMTKTAVDIAILDGESAKGASNSTNGNPTFREKGNLVKDALVKLGYTWNTESGNEKAVLWQTNTGGNHYNHLHVSNNSGASPTELDAMSLSSATGSPDGEGSVLTVDDIKVLINKLKEKNITSEDLKKHIDQVKSATVDPIMMTGDWIDMTKQLLRKYEGFEDNAKWDENAYRGGYGSDKKLVNGRLENATSSTTWTRQEAEDTLDYEIKNQYGPIVIKQLGNENWSKLNDKQKASLVSLGYNAGPYFLTARDYGKNIKKSIESGDMEAAATYIAQGPTTGAGSGKYYSQLQKRRKEEAQLFLS